MTYHMRSPEVDRLDDKLATLFDVEQRAEHLCACLERLRTAVDLQRFFYRYVTFNSIFAAGVTALASAIHVRVDLFRDPRDPNDFASDRSAEVASHVFRAAEDEYRVSDSTKEVTHRTMAQQLLRRIDSHFGFEAPEPNSVWSSRFADCLSKVKCNYSIGQLEPDAGVLFRGLGFHLASEQCAKQEFSLLDGFLRESYGTLVNSLCRIRETWGLNAYYWIEAHCNVEEQHWRAAVTAKDLAAEYFVARDSDIDMAESLCEGYIAFSEIQRAFFTHVTED